jgi:hypothetical protein
MVKSIKLFKSLEELDAYHIEMMKQSTIEERFRRLKAMQEFTLLMHPPADKIKKITIKKWTC